MTRQSGYGLRPASIRAVALLKLSATMPAQCNHAGSEYRLGIVLPFILGSPSPFARHDGNSPCRG